MKAIDIANDSELLELDRLLDFLHKEGPVDQQILEALSYYKEFHPEEFAKIEEQVICSLGLFYKIDKPSNLYSFLLSGIGEEYKHVYGAKLTPVQANVRNALDVNRVISISAPTSAGKSYSVREFIAEQTGDAVVIVPSRALIAEYVNAIKRRFKGDKSVMVSVFVDNIFTTRNLRHIFVLTPERARELFAFPGKFNINIFFLDEAQISEEKERGVQFDVLVRRIKKQFPEAKIVFAHPFVENPEAQLKKHGFLDSESYARPYTFGSVGKICVFEHFNKSSYYFSPFSDKGHLLKNCIEFPGRFGDFAFNGNHSVLVYVSKASIYKGTFLDGFDEYIDGFETVEDEDALHLIDTVSQLLGADQDGHDSHLVNLMRKGVVTHHGSIPLEVRFLIEEFIRKGFARICFATSTLAQGVNMPFDIVWLENMRFLGENDSTRSLGFKNLIGRAGRLSTSSIFDYGYVFTKRPLSFTKLLKDNFNLNEISVLDAPLEEQDIDSSELIESIKQETFDEDKQIPISKVERLSKEHVLMACNKILDYLYKAEKSIKENIGGEAKKIVRSGLMAAFRTIFEESINRDLKIWRGSSI